MSSLSRLLSRSFSRPWWARHVRDSFRTACGTLFRMGGGEGGDEHSNTLLDGFQPFPARSSDKTDVEMKTVVM